MSVYINISLSIKCFLFPFSPENLLNPRKVSFKKRKTTKRSSKTTTINPQETNRTLRLRTAGIEYAPSIGRCEVWTRPEGIQAVKESSLGRKKKGGRKKKKESKILLLLVEKKA